MPGPGPSGDRLEHLDRLAISLLGLGGLAERALDLADAERGDPGLGADDRVGVPLHRERLVIVQCLLQELALDRLQAGLLAQPFVGDLGVHLLDGAAGLVRWRRASACDRWTSACLASTARRRCPARAGRRPGAGRRRPGPRRAGEPIAPNAPADQGAGPGWAGRRGTARGRRRGPAPWRIGPPGSLAIALRMIVSRSRGTAGWSERGPARLLLGDPAEQLLAVGALEDRPEGHQLVEGRAQRVDVGPLVNDRVVGRRLLGAHVAQRAQHVAGRRQARLALEPGQAEVGDPEVPPAVDHQVRRLDVAVQHPLLVRVLERLGRLAAQPGGLAEEGAIAGRVSGSAARSRRRRLAGCGERCRVRAGGTGGIHMRNAARVAVRRRERRAMVRVASSIPSWRRSPAISCGERRPVDELHGVVVDATLDSRPSTPGRCADG